MLAPNMSPDTHALSATVGWAKEIIEKSQVVEEELRNPRMR